MPILDRPAMANYIADVRNIAEKYFLPAPAKSIDKCAYHAYVSGGDEAQL